MIFPEPALSMRLPQRLRALLRAAPALALAAGACALAVGYPGEAAADIFSFTDAEGVIHFANKPTGDGRFRLYLKSSPRGAARAGVVPFMPSDTSGDRFTRYDEWIHQAAILYQIPEELIRSVIMVESNYDPRAVSPTGAQGLMQLMPETGLRMSVRDPFDPRENIFGGTRYLRVLANMFNGDLSLTIAGYNAGEAAVVRFAGIPPYEETQGYVTRVLGYYRRYRTLGDPALASASY
jgi:soluble lytic murein transglycosylase-like protein